MTTGAALRGMADLAVGLSSGPGTLYLGGVIKNTVWVTNLGPGTATGVVVTNSLSSGQVVVAGIGSLAAGAVGSASVAIAPTQSGEITTTVFAAGNEADLNPANNTAQATSVVSIAAPAVLSGAMVNGQFHLTVAAQPCCAYAVLVSTNLTSWTSLCTNSTSTNGFFKYTDTTSSATTRRYYRTARIE